MLEYVLKRLPSLSDFGSLLLAQEAGTNILSKAQSFIRVAQNLDQLLFDSGVNDGFYHLDKLCLWHLPYCIGHSLSFLRVQLLSSN